MKKVLSFVLVLCMVLSSLTFAFADTTSASLKDIAGDANEEAIKVNNDLGIITGYTDGTFKPEKSVNRAEFAAMITRALDIPESALAGYTKTTFKDVDGFGWAIKYLAFCNDKGIMLGDGNGNAMPAQTITVNQAMTMVLRAIGYTNNSSVLVGSWPANYVTLAQQLNLYDDVEAVELVDRGSAAQIIYNVLTVELVQVAADGKTDGLGTSLLVANQDCTKSDGELVLFTDPAEISTIDYVGAWAEVYKNEDGSIVAVKPISTFLTGTVDGTTFTTEDDVDYTIVDGTLTMAGINASIGAVTTDIATWATTNTVTIAADVSGKKINEIYSAQRWVVTTDEMAADDVQEDIAADTPVLLTKALPLNDDDAIDTTKLVVKGVASLQDIAEDNVVYVYTVGNAPAADIVKVEVGTATVAGEFTKIKGDDYTFAGSVYALAKDNHAVTQDDVTGIDVTAEGTVYLDFDGDIYYFDVDDAAAGHYAMFVAQNETGSFGTTSYAVKLVTNEGEEAIYDVDEDATDVIDAITGGALTTTAIYEYSLNKAGAVDALRAATTAVAVSGDKVSATRVGTYKVASNIVVFVQDDDEVVVKTIAALDDTITGTAIVNAAGEVKALYVTAGYTTSDDIFGIVEAMGIETKDADGDKATGADALVDGKASAEYIYTAANAANISVTATNGALAVITIDSDGNITKTADASVDYNSQVVTVKAISGTQIKSDDATPKYYDVTADATVYVYDISDDAWKVGKLSDAKGNTVTLWDTDDKGADADGIFDIIVVIQA